MQKPTALGVFDGGESFPEPALEEHELTVDARKDATVHQQVAQVGDRSPGCPLVEPFVGERDVAVGQALKETDDVGVAEPDKSASGPIHLQQGRDQGQECGRNVSGALVEETGE
ncbi:MULTISPECIES: hypothetical protein [Streptomyces]|uniref:hypothetical protein n=1 Tax=Streptomyces TaxID=1883 RepID=UPI00069A7543|nr:hypothetical protein [Streptomyces sp. SID7805]MYU51595.1 hypothetical protein [Streptomyces sp. SID7805]